MRTIDPALQAHFDEGATTLCHCWQLVRRDGVVLGFTDHDRSLSFDGGVFEPASGVNGAAISSSADLAVDNSEFEGALDSEKISASDLIAGRYDGARIDIWRVNWADVSQRLLLKKVVIGEVRRVGDKFTAELRGLAHVLDQTSGRVYQRQCDAIVGDHRCGVDLSSPAFKSIGTVTAVVDEQRFIVDGLDGFADGWFVHGVLQWQSGANAGQRAHIKTQNGGAIDLWLPAGSDINIGDQFDITAGCDKAANTCTEKFSNLINFRGFHLMPGNDFAVSYPLRGESNDGGQR